MRVVIHDVASIEVEPLECYDGHDGPFWTRTIVIKDKDGKKHEIDMFSYKDEDDLSLNVKR
jgi:hypothetical protein